ncbi:MAG: efflux RND transporter permease subunit [Clostridium sp.]|nr:efflux RND transporter permease subunit [Clostridium sp.]
MHAATQTHRTHSSRNPPFNPTVMTHRLSFATLVYFIALSAVGLCLIPRLTVKQAPGRTLPRLSVSFSMHGQSPRAVESGATSQIEAMLSRISGITDISSVSGNGTGKITLTLDKQTDVDAVRFEVSTAIRQLWPQLPAGVSYPEVGAWYSDSRASGPLLSYTLNAPGNPGLILQYAETHIRPVLTRTEGVAAVEISGARPMEWLLEYDRNRLEEMNVTPADMEHAIATQMGSRFVGMTNRAEENYCAVYVKPTVSRADQLARVAVKKADGKIVRLDELVTIIHREQPPRTYHRINGLTTIYLTIYADEQANQIRLSNTLRNKIKQLETTFPVGYELRLSSDSSESIREELTDVAIRTSATLLILLVFVFLVHRDWRYLTVITLSVGANIALSFILYYLLDIEIQIYSVAGITISLGLVIDNILIMADHILRHRRMNIFMAILASTLTTIASLAVVFFLDEKEQLNLLDFSRVLIVNLSVSLAVALLLVPALLQGTSLSPTAQAPTLRRKRRVARLTRLYANQIGHLCRHKRACCAAFILSFGLPVFLIPTTLQGNEPWVKLYNTVMGSDVSHMVRSYTAPLLGGSLRLFMQRTSSGARMSRDANASVSVRAHMPYGSSLDDMDGAMRIVESVIAQTEGVKHYHTHVYSAQTAHTYVAFTREGIARHMPQRLKDALVKRVVHIGNATWDISAPDQGFSNNLDKGYRSNRIRLSGYNYDELTKHALQVCRLLEQHQRVQRIAVVPHRGYNDRDYEEFIFETTPDQLLAGNLNVGSLNTAMQAMLPRQITAGHLISRENGLEDINLSPTSTRTADIWTVEHRLQQTPTAAFRIGEAATITRRQLPREIEKANQQYQLYVEYDFVGGGELSGAIRRQVIEEYAHHLPMGYEISDGNAYDHSTQQKPSDLIVILLIILIIYIICCVLYNSFVMPLVVIAVIPVSFIGIFLSFNAFNIPFNQGGLAAFILLSGLTCNSVIYLLNDYVSLRRTTRLGALQAYLKAFNSKIIPILLTILSTALGFVPFMFDAKQDSFWMALSVGTICGLFFSVVGLMFYLPIMLCPADRPDARKGLRKTCVALWNRMGTHRLQALKKT